jgi:hypothetical protein
MKYEILTVRDAAVSEFMRPFHARTVPEGMRIFKEWATDPTTEINKNPEDYSLFHHGTFDGGSGGIEVLPQPTRVANALDFIQGE